VRALASEFLDQFFADQHADAVAQQRSEMATVLGCYEPRTGLPCDLGNVRIVDPAACCPFSCGRDQELFL
jgi:hypothetical protein